MTSFAAMRRISAELRQYQLDFAAPIPPCPTPPRLLILACSATKAVGDDLAARDRYNGPLWQTLRAADPEGDLAFVSYLSAKYGLGCARSKLPNYDAVLNARSAAAMAAAGIGEIYPRAKLDQKTDAGRARAIAAIGRRQTARGVVQGMVNQLEQPFSEVAICGGRHYVTVGAAYVRELQDAGSVGLDAKVTIINDEIGYMRAGLRRWLTAKAEEQ